MKLVTLLGSFGGKPTIKTANGTAYSHFSVAVDDTNRDGEAITEWYEVVAFGKIAAGLSRVESRDEVLVHGSFHQTTYAGRGGVQYHDIEIKAWKIKLLGRRNRSARGPDPAAEPQ